MEAVLPSRAAQPPIPLLPLQPPQPTSPCILWPSLCTLWWAARLQLSSITQLLQLQPQPRTPLHLPASWVFTLQSRAFWRTRSTWPAPTGTSPACPAPAHSASLCPPLLPHCTACLWPNEQDPPITDLDCLDQCNEPSSSQKIVKWTAKVTAGARTCTYCIYLLPCKLLLFFSFVSSALFIQKYFKCTRDFIRLAKTVIYLISVVMKFFVRNGTGVSNCAGFLFS